ncbi:AAA family ATPase [Enterobacter cloacae]|uniref:retron Ec78 anti-phage system effector ATPase PtuA n=1 Tax=Enterobacter cloacae TaxID=550 RepID=UPI002003B5A8|nr:retron Ec78 anti-phage system effector ATPase PtuA [Enterobacter cloacae]MCK7265653.1 AAA family ATPase [Enterobacter cloacae]HBL4972090.1 AAA family ATPase [Enterobacter cloacae]
MNDTNSKKNQENKIRALKRNALKGNISSMFELMGIYEKGTDVPIDLKLSNEYYKMCVDSLGFKFDSNNEIPKNKIKLDYLLLVNFRRFTKVDIIFDDKVTVFIGDNGAGKTTLLDAIARTFSYINARIIAKNRNGRSLDDFDVKVDCNSNAEAITSISLGSYTKYSGSLARAAKGIENSKASELESYTQLSALFRTINYRLLQSINSPINIPLFAYYPVERSLIKSNQTFDIERFDTVSIESRFDSLDKSAIDGASNIEESLKWFIYNDNLVNNDHLINERRTIETEIKALSSIENLPKALSEELTKRKLRLEQLDSNISDTVFNYSNKVVRFFKDAIIKSVPSITDIFIDRTSGRLEVKIINDKETINIFQASKGQLVYLALIADLARRLISLNPTLNNPLNGQGIVLIDEVELHLHPEWQQNIIRNLTSTFPNLQFIITTHSPQVLSTVSKKNIRKLSENIHGEEIIATPMAESYARSSSEVLSTVMHVEPIPKFPERKKLEKYRKIIEQGDFRSEEASNLLHELTLALGADHEELISLSIVRRRREKFE